MNKDVMQNDDPGLVGVMMPHTPAVFEACEIVAADDSIWDEVRYVCENITE